MKVILLKDVKAQGKKGDLINVSDGYAHNYLIPGKLAIEADKAAMNELNNRLAAERFKLEEQKKAALALSEKLLGVQLILTEAAGSEDRMYGSVTSADIQEALKAQAGIEIDKRKIELTEPIKTFGAYSVSVRLFTDITAKINLIVKAK